MPNVEANPRVLKWAREYHNLTIDSAATQLKLSVDELREIESGVRPLNNTILQRMTQKYKFPESLLLLMNVPEDAPKPPESYRTVVGRPPELSQQTIIVIRKVYSQLQDLADLSEVDKAYKIAELPKYDRRVNAVRMGENERSRVGITIREQLRWQDPKTAFRQWRKAIEEQGICVYLEKYPEEDCKAFSVYADNWPPAIVVNKANELAVVKVFSLLHEFGHLLIRQPGLSDLDDRNTTEAFCNDFAAGFLMPQEALEKALNNLLLDRPRDWSVEEIKRGAFRLSVSQQSLALRLEKANYATEGFYQWYCEQQDEKEFKKPEQKRKNIKIKQIYKLRNNFGYHHTGAVISALERGIITSFDATRLLNTKPEHVENLRQLF